MRSSLLITWMTPTSRLETFWTVNVCLFLEISIYFCLLIKCIGQNNIHFISVYLYGERTRTEESRHTKFAVEIKMFLKENVDRRVTLEWNLSIYDSGRSDISALHMFYCLRRLFSFSFFLKRLLTHEQPSQHSCFNVLNWVKRSHLIMRHKMD